jgi:hypothetical protein
VLVARYLSEVVPIEILAPLTDIAVELDTEPRHNFIDDEILETLELLGLQPSSQSTDAAYTRRVTLDLTGRLPSLEQIRRSSNREEFVDELLASDAFTEYWTLQIAKLLRIRPQGDDSLGAETYHNWLMDQVADDASYKQLARSLILSSGDSHKHGPANFYRTVRGAREQAEFMSELFMGSRLRCANCHNHPLDRWTQDDYHGLAAIFAKVEPGKVVKLKPKGQVIHPRTLEPALQRIPGERFLDVDGDGRERLADWLTDSANPFFAKAIVNRLWKRMMGRGLVEPADDFRATNPATHPELLNKLAKDFIANGFRIRHTLGTIARSSTYARSVNASESNKDDDRFYSHSKRRPLEPEVLADAISDVLGVDAVYGDEPDGTRAVMLIDPDTDSLSLDILGRCERKESCENVSDVGGLSQKLHLLNGELLNARIAADGSRLDSLLESKKTPKEIIHTFYIAALSRSPTQVETKHWDEVLSAIESEEQTTDFLEDFVWGLLTCNEFVTNH